ncbi:MAG: HAMP domain-containing histidine kinase [Ruminococcus sp.]|nr:HAMP domain-containing histidine kinase [Candidatus Copronaster equi]
MLKKVKKRNRIFRKYLVIITSVILITIFVICTSYLLIATRYWNDNQTETLVSNAENVARSSEKLLYMVIRQSGGNDDTIDVSPLILICNTLRQLSDALDADIFITNTDGRVIFCKEMINNEFNISGKEVCDYHKNINISKEIINKSSKSSYKEVDTLGDVFEDVQFTGAVPIKIGGKTIAIVFATKPITQAWYNYARQILRIFLISALIGLAISFVTVYFLSYRLTKPLRQMSIATKKYAKGDFSYKVDVRGNDEVSELSQAFNTMAMSLSALESSRRSFVANVSHELKTPMTSIGGFIDGMLDGTISEEEYPYYLKLVSDEVKRLSRLVTGMLNMSKIESGDMPINIKKFDIAEDIVKTLLSFEQKITNKSIDILGLDNFENLYINADEDMMRQVIYNLIDNAVKFTPENGYILFSAFQQNNATVISIKNSGAGIEREEIGKIFERFYKVDKSRSYDVKGAGLGLYLCKSIIELHGGHISVNSIVGEYTEFIFRIPNEIK